MRNVAAAISVIALVAGCATPPSRITAQYISPVQYQSLDCDQISAELQRVGAKVSEVTGQQQRAASSDQVAMGVGLVLFWPALFFLANDNNKKEELSRLKGEYDALQQVANMKSCFKPKPAAVTEVGPTPAPAAPVQQPVQPPVAVAPGASPAAPKT